MEVIPEATSSNEESESSRNGTPSSRKAPSLRGSAKFRRVGSANSGNSIEEKMSALQTLLADQLLITEFPGTQGIIGKTLPDVQYPDSDLSDDDTRSSFSRDRSCSREDDYETDLDMDYDEWINEEKLQIERDFSGEKKYIHICNQTGVIPVTYFLRHIDNTEFTMKFHGLGPLGAKAISFPLKDNDKIQKLNLEGNWIMGEGSEYLAKMLKNNIFVTHLYLAENHIGNRGCEAIGEMLTKNDTIYTLDLSGNHIEDNGAAHICRMLLKNTTIRHIYLANNRFEERAAYLFRDVLCHNEAIETLDLSWNHFRTRGAIALGEGLMENYGLKCIKLAMNGFGRPGAEALGKALKNNRTLTELNVSHNRIPEVGSQGIAKGLLTNDTLKVLRIGSNPLGAEGPIALLNAIRKNDMSSIEIVDLSNVLVTRDFQDLASKLETNRSMEIIHGGIIGEPVQTEYISHDPLAEFRRDPMTKLQEYARNAGYRMIDLFKEFDRDGNMAISEEEFIMGIKRAGIKISVRQFEVLLDRLDRDKNGFVEYGELVETDNIHRTKKREILSLKNKRLQQQENTRTTKDTED